MTTAPLNIVRAQTSADLLSKGSLGTYSEFGSRILLSALFLIAGVGKLGAYASTAAYMSSHGVPGELLPGVITIEVVGSLAVVLGWKTRIAAVVLAGFSLLAAVIFHHNFSDPLETLTFLKDLSVAGGLILLAAHGAGPLSVDHRLAGAQTYDQAAPTSRR